MICAPTPVFISHFTCGGAEPIRQELSQLLWAGDCHLKPQPPASIISTVLTQSLNLPIQKAQIGLVLIDIHHTHKACTCNTHYTTHMLHVCILCVLHVWTYFICTYNPGHQQAGHWLFQSSTLLIWLCIDEPCLPQWTDGIRFWEAIPNSLSYQHSIPPLGVRRAAD